MTSTGGGPPPPPYPLSLHPPKYLTPFPSPNLFPMTIQTPPYPHRRIRKGKSADRFDRRWTEETRVYMERPTELFSLLGRWDFRVPTLKRRIDNQALRLSPMSCPVDWCSSLGVDSARASASVLTGGIGQAVAPPQSHFRPLGPSERL